MLAVTLHGLWLFCVIVIIVIIVIVEKLKTECSCILSTFIVVMLVADCCYCMAWHPPGSRSREADSKGPDKSGLLLPLLIVEQYI